MKMIFDRSLRVRSKVKGQKSIVAPMKEMDFWLVWAGIATDANAPMSQIGIYTDFT